MSANWAIGAIPLRFDMTKPAAEIAGWQNGTFGLDWRPAVGAAEDAGASGVWAITHLQTGYSAGCLMGTLDEAQAFVADLQSVTCWDFSDHLEAPKRAHPYQECKAAFLADNPKCSIFSGGCADRPLMGLPA